MFYRRQFILHNAREKKPAQYLTRTVNSPNWPEMFNPHPETKVEWAAMV